MRSLTSRPEVLGPVLAHCAERGLEATENLATCGHAGSRSGGCCVCDNSPDLL